MPDVDWERVAEALFTAERLESNYERGLDDRMVVEPEVLAAARWGLEAQQRGERVWWCEMHASAGRPNADRPPEICEGSLNVAYRIGKNPYDRISCRFTEHLLVPLEGEQ